MNKHEKRPTEEEMGHGAWFTLDGERMDLEDFFASNPDLDPEDVDAIRGLKAGESLTLGGGAWATFTIALEPSISIAMPPTGDDDPHSIVICARCGHMLDFEEEALGKCRHCGCVKTDTVTIP